jgi:NADPH:quinone reductase-like Zn-dependent oxidoreductase
LKAIVSAEFGFLADLFEVKALCETGKIKAIVDRSSPMERAAEAHRSVESGLRQGSVVIR